MDSSSADPVPGSARAPAAARAETPSGRRARRRRSAALPVSGLGSSRLVSGSVTKTAGMGHICDSILGGRKKKFLPALPAHHWVTLIEEILEIGKQMGKKNNNNQKRGKNPLLLATAYRVTQ